MKRTFVRRLLLAAALIAGLGACAAFKVVPEVSDFMLPMRDGVKLYTVVARPRGAEKCPVIITRTPYVEEIGANKATVRMMSIPACMRGYACILQHCRGCGESEGDFVPFEAEREDGLALLDWIRRQPWYNGEIFLVGGSYHSSVHWAYLDTNPPDVKGAVLPVMDVDRYNADYRNGVFKTGLFGVWSQLVYRRKDRTLKRDASARLCDFPLSDWVRRYYGIDEPTFDNIVRHPRRDDPFWLSGEPGSGTEYRRGFTDSTMPILLVTGQYDMFFDGMADMWCGASPERRANCAMLVDAYDHDGRVADELKGTRGEFAGGARMSDPVKMLDWFDCCRTGKACDFAPAGKARCYALWENRWIGEEAFADGPRRVEFTLGTGARSWTYDPRRPLPEFPGSGGNCFGGMRRQPEPDFRDDVVSFVLPPAEEELRVRGRMRASLAVSSDCEDTCIYVRVSVDKGDGVWYLLRDDITTLCADGRPYVPGSEKTVSFAFPRLAFRLEKGDRLRVDVASACSQFAPHGNVKGNQSFVREPKTARNSVVPERSSLTLCAEGGLSSRSACCRMSADGHEPDVKGNR